MYRNWSKFMKTNVLVVLIPVLIIIELMYFLIIEESNWTHNWISNVRNELLGEQLKDSVSNRKTGASGSNARRAKPIH